MPGRACSGDCQAKPLSSRWISHQNQRWIAIAANGKADQSCSTSQFRPRTHWYTFVTKWTHLWRIRPIFFQNVLGALRSTVLQCFRRLSHGQQLRLRLTAVGTRGVLGGSAHVAVLPNAECRSVSDELAANAATVCDGCLCGMPADGAVEAIAKQAQRWRLNIVNDGLAQPKRSGQPADWFGRHPCDGKLCGAGAAVR